MTTWMFVTNHGAVLAAIAEHGEITARDIAASLGVTERSVRRIIANLEREGYIEKTRSGRVNRYQVNHSLPLRRPERRDVLVGDLLQALLPGGLADQPWTAMGEEETPSL